MVALILGIPGVIAVQQMEWTPATMDAAFADRLLHSSVVYNEGIWVIGGHTGGYTFFGDVWRSDDGITWTQVTPYAEFGPRGGHESVVFNGRMWVIAGREGGTLKFKNDIWYSTDGITWTLAREDLPFAPRVEFAAVVYDDKIWILGGNANDGTPINDVWYSRDGITWIEATPHAGFSPRMEPSACVYNGRIWVTGGFDWRGVYNDVWSSSDGISWTRVTPHAAFEARRYQNMAVADGKMWVIGGYNGKDPLNDTWYSTDGITWTLAKGSKSYSPRWGFSSVVFDDRFWVIGGTTGNDVWYSGKIQTAAFSEGSPELDTTPTKIPSGGIMVNKSISPSSIKQGTDAKVMITVHNAGSMPIHDIEILDATSREFPVIDGVTQFSFSTLDPHDTRILTYSVHAVSAGSFRLNRTTVMYADHEGNYHIVRSGSPRVTVLAPLISSAPEEGSGSFFSNLAAWFEGLNLFDEKRTLQT